MVSSPDLSLNYIFKNHFSKIRLHSQVFGHEHIYIFFEVFVGGGRDGEKSYYSTHCSDKHFLSDFHFDCCITQNPILDRYSVGQDTRWGKVLEVSLEVQRKVSRVKEGFIETILLVIDLEGSIDFYQMVGVAWNMQIVVVAKIRSLLHLIKEWSFEK